MTDSVIKPINTKKSTGELLQELAIEEFWYGKTNKISKTNLLKIKRIIATLLLRANEPFDDVVINGIVAD